MVVMLCVFSVVLFFLLKDNLFRQMNMHIDSEIEKAAETARTAPSEIDEIEEIKEYEQSNFGTVSTDLSSSEKVVNMYAYIKGEEILNECETLREKWNDTLTAEDLKQVEKELEELL
jgi:hypothetical protein